MSDLASCPTAGGWTGMHRRSQERESGSFPQKKTPSILSSTLIAGQQLRSCDIPSMETLESHGNHRRRFAGMNLIVAKILNIIEHFFMQGVDHAIIMIPTNCGVRTVCLTCVGVWRRSMYRC